MVSTLSRSYLLLQTTAPVSLKLHFFLKRKEYEYEIKILKLN